jgi:hypothetical protein
VCHLVSKARGNGILREFSFRRALCQKSFRLENIKVELFMASTVMNHFYASVYALTRRCIGSRAYD